MNVAWPSDEVLAIVAIAPPPPIPLAELGELLVPVEDEAGLVDWHLRMPSTPGSNAVTTYWDWSRTWATFRGVGSLGNIANLLDRFGDGLVSPASELVTLLQRIAGTVGDIVVTTLECDVIEAEIEVLARDLAAAHETGFGLIDDMPRRNRTTGIARMWAPPRGDVVLAGIESTMVMLREDVGLVVLHGPQRQRAFEGVTHVDLRRETVLLVGADGAELVLRPADARPLAWLLPRSLLWHVERISLPDVWAPLLIGLPAAIQEARRSGLGLRLTTNSRVIA
jgi:hypothetical protein